MKRLVLILSALALVLVACDEKKSVSGTTTTPSASAGGVASVASIVPPSATTTASTSGAVPKAVPDAIAAQHVLVAYKGAKGAPKTITRSKADAKKRAEEVASKAKGGGDFSALVAEYSDDPGSKERMGSVGKFTRDKMVKPFSDAAFALSVDEVSGVVESEFGFHVIKRNQ
jgi:parvulin-like peptidyl-prolyl isomerase